jgi:ATP-dependent RNA helicase DDX46/PRP5
LQIQSASRTHIVVITLLSLFPAPQEFGIVGNDEEEEAPESEDDDIRPSTQGQQQQQTAAAGIIVTPATAAAVAAAINGPAATPGLPGAPKFLPAQPGQQFPGQAVAQAPSALVAAATAAAAQVSGVTPAAAQVPASSSLAAAQAAAMRAAALAAAYAQGGGAPTAPAAAPAAAVTAPVRAAGFETEIEINDFPQNARWKVTHKGFQQDITDMTGAAVTTKGIYMAQGEPG